MATNEPTTFEEANEQIPFRHDLMEDETKYVAGVINRLESVEEYLPDEWRAWGNYDIQRISDGPRATARDAIGMYFIRTRDHYEEEVFDTIHVHVPMTPSEEISVNTRHQLKGYYDGRAGRVDPKVFSDVDLLRPTIIGVAKMASSAQEILEDKRTPSENKALSRITDIVPDDWAYAEGLPEYEGEYYENGVGGDGFILSISVPDSSTREFPNDESARIVLRHTDAPDARNEKNFVKEIRADTVHEAIEKLEELLICREEHLNIRLKKVEHRNN